MQKQGPINTKLRVLHIMLVHCFASFLYKTCTTENLQKNYIALLRFLIVFIKPFFLFNAIGQ